MKLLRQILRRLVLPLRSRKVRQALATVLAAYLADHHLKVDPSVILTILGVGASLILGTAVEDHAVKLQSPSDTGRLVEIQCGVCQEGQ